MPVPLLDLTRQNLALEAEFKAAFERVLRSGHYILGPELTAMEKGFAQYLGAKHALGISSGTDALLLAFMALNLGPGDEVLVPDFTFFATAGCVARTGATPVFVDVCPVCFNLDVADTAKKITPRTKAIVPVHLFGQSADMQAILALAKKHQLAVVEDAAQSLGARYQGKQVGTLGDFGAYSFFPTKNLGALGDAGLLVTNDDTLAERATILRVHGMKPKYHHQAIGGNFRLDALQAAMLRVKLPHFDSYNQARQANAAWYVEKLSRVPGVAVARTKKCQPCSPAPTPAAKLTLPATCPQNDHIWNQFTLRVHGEGRRDDLLAHLQQKRIGAEIYYPIPLHQQKCFAANSHSGANCVNSRLLASEVLSIPIFPELTAAERAEVANAIEEFLK